MTRLYALSGGPALRMTPPQLRNAATHWTNCPRSQSGGLLRASEAVEPSRTDQGASTNRVVAARNSEESLSIHVRDLNWMQLQEYLTRDDRVVLPVGSTEQHAYLSLETDNIIAERLAVEAADGPGVPVLPVLPYGVTGFVAYPGSPTLRLETFAAAVRDL